MNAAHMNAARLIRLAQQTNAEASLNVSVGPDPDSASGQAAPQSQLTWTASRRATAHVTAAPSRRGEG